MMDAIASADSPRSTLRSNRCGALATILGVIGLGGTALASDQFVAINGAPPNSLTRLRTPADSWIDSGIVNMGYGPSGLTHDGAHLYWFAAVGVTQAMLRRLDPSTGQMVSIGISGGWAASLPALENHPQTGVLYALVQGVLLTIDKSTALATPVAVLSGGPAADVRSFAIDSTGRALAMSRDGELFELDLATGVLTPLGALGLPVSESFDLAFDSQDQLWAVRNFNVLYSIDVSGVAATLHSAGNVLSVASLAFVPGGLLADWSPYCLSAQPALTCLMQPYATNAPASVSATSGFNVFMSTPRAGSPALLVYGVAGRALVPFHGGALCVAAPLRRTPMQQSTAMPVTGCDGFVSLDFAAFAAGSLGGSPNPALQVAGVVVNAQWLVREPSSSAGAGLLTSAAIEFTLHP